MKRYCGPVPGAVGGFVTFKKIISVLSVLALAAACLASCGSDSTLGEVETTEKPTRSYREEPTEEGTTAEAAEPVVQDGSWMSNYSLQYYYADTQGSSQISETRAGGYYTAVDATTGYTTFFSQGDGGVDEYVLNVVSKTGTHKFSEGDSMDTLTSGWMQVSHLDEGFTTAQNVLYEGKETVAGREAGRYLQSIYVDDALTAYAFVWVDTQYGFASKCSVYTVSGSLYSAWELTSFTAGTVTDEQAITDITQYTIAET